MKWKVVPFDCVALNNFCYNSISIVCIVSCLTSALFAVLLFYCLINGVYLRFDNSPFKMNFPDFDSLNGEKSPTSSTMKQNGRVPSLIYYPLKKFVESDFWYAFRPTSASTFSGDCRRCADLYRLKHLRSTLKTVYLLSLPIFCPVTLGSMTNQPDQHGLPWSWLL